MIVKSKSSSDLKLELATLSALCRSVNTPRSILINLLIENEQISDILTLTVKPEDYSSSLVQKFKDDLLVTKFLSKSPNLDLGIDRRAEALKTFFEGEMQCEAAADRLRHLDPTSEEFNFLHDVKATIFSILGVLGKKDLRSIEHSFSFGPGSTTRVGGSFIGSDKFDGSPHLTEALYPFYKSLLGPIWHENADCPEIVEGNRFTTVPKNAKTDRGICVEPDLNSFVQLGIGTVLKRKLAAVGIDLSNQTINQRLAKRAYKDRLATIDLRSASDTISLYLVYFLIPPRWFALLEMCRSHKTLVNDVYHQNHKFSSMGNGYTFELESLIFTAIVQTIVPIHLWNDCSVYGDDIIVPQAYSTQVISALELCGFTVNPEKSFLAGSFFESCGTDFFNSVPVRPFHALGSSNGIPYSLQLANALRLYSRIPGYGCDNAFKGPWLSLVKDTPSNWRKCRVPSSLGDSGIFDGPLNLRKVDGHLELFIVYSIKRPPVKKISKSIGFLLLALTKIGAPDLPFTRNQIPRRGMLGVPVVSRTLVNSVDLDMKWVSARSNSLVSSLKIN